MDRPYDPNSQLNERDEPTTFEALDEEQGGGSGPSTMDKTSANAFNFDGPTAPPAPTSASRHPSIPRSIDNTALDAYMSCPRKFYYGMVAHRRGRVGMTLPPPLAYGTTWHAIMEAHYKTGGDIGAVTDAAFLSWRPHNQPEDHRTLERCIMEYGKFLQRYGDHDQETKAWGLTIGYPDSPVVELPAEIWWPGAAHPYTGKIDRIYENQGLYYVEDHKTTSALGPTYFRQFDPSNQMMGYAWLAQKLTGLPIAGVRINAHAVLKGSSKFERQTIMFSPERLEEWAANLNEWIERIASSFVDLNPAGPPVVHDDALLRAFPHNFNACAGKYGQCIYTDVCTMPLRSRGRVLENDFELHPWNPLNPDEDAE
jgi:hypothetical protein